MSHNPDACDLYQFMSGILAEPDNQKELGAVVRLGNACDGTCDNAEHRFEIVTSEGDTFELVLRPPAKGKAD